MSFNYGPGLVAQPLGSPKCYGQGFNADDRECRSCPYQGPCKDIVIQTKWQQQQQQAPAFAAPFQPQPYQPQQPAYQQPQPVRAFSPPQFQPAQPQQQPRWAPVQQAAPQPQAIQKFGGVYGAVPDPLFGVLHGAPTPFRPQQPGEEFMERWAKNMFLAAFESMAKELVVGIRQMLWAPSLPPPPQPPTIDMSHQPKQ